MVKRMRSVVAVLVCLVQLNVLAAGEHIDVQEIRFDSEVLGETRDIEVFLPAGYGESNTRFPVLYLTDGDIQGPHTAGTLDYLAKFDLTPNMIIVGIVNPRHTRQRDLTLPNKDQQGSDQIEGADLFLTFVEKEVIPLVKKRYRTLSYQALSGTSHGGQFAINAMVNRPDLFDGIVAISPTLYWNNKQLLALSKKAFEKQSLKGRLFVSVANEEALMTEPYKNFVELTQQYPSKELDVSSQVFSQESHNSTTLLGQYYGLKHLFFDWAIPDSPQTLADLQGIYAQRSSLLGTSLTIPEDRANGFGQWLQYLNRQQDALALFEWNRNTYSDSLNAHEALIRAYLHFSLADQAKVAVEQAITTLTALDDKKKQKLRELVIR